MKFTLCTAIILLAAAGSVRAQTIIGTEDPVNGFVGPLFANFTDYMVASDGETSFQPFGITVDVSDAISLNVGFVWTLDQGVTGWTQVPGQQIWYIDAASVGENEPSSPEPIGYFSSPSAWNPTLLGTYQILDTDGTWDEINVYNTTDANGVTTAHISFNSDAPTPGAVALLGVGGLMGARRRRRS